MPLDSDGLICGAGRVGGVEGDNKSAASRRLQSDLTERGREGRKELLSELYVPRLDFRPMQNEKQRRYVTAHSQ